MTWFKVDDGLHSHPKAAAVSLAALGLWTVAGSWSSKHLTEGDVPEAMVKLLSRGADELAHELVTAGLWRRTKTGYRFHQWSADSDGTKRNPTRKEVEEERKANAARQAAWRERQKTRGRNAVTNTVTNSATNGTPTRPDPPPKGGEGRRRATPAPSADPRCDRCAHRRGSASCRRVCGDAA